tara:strand:+ start:930 stop:1181 length:252 start_codon:yes stop_codon:yes gene_type:complete
MNILQQRVIERQAAKADLCAEHFGFPSAEECVEACIFDGVMPSICTNGACEYSTEYEPDQEHGFCEACGENTVVSIAVLQGVL